MTLRQYSALFAMAAFFLVFAGGRVASTDSALAVMVITMVVLLTVILAVWLWHKGGEPLLKKAGLVAVALVGAQGALGVAAALRELPAVSSVGQACLGQLFFGWTCCIAAMVWSRRSAFPYPEARPLRRLALMTTGFAFFQLLSGAIYRQTGFLLHVHFLGAALVFAHVLLLAKRLRSTLRQDFWFARLAMILVGLAFLQISLGFYAWQRPTLPNTAAHVAVGALILAGCAVVSLQSFRRVGA